MTHMVPQVQDVSGMAQYPLSVTSTDAGNTIGDLFRPLTHTVTQVQDVKSMAQVVWVYHSDGRRSSEGCMNGISLCRICVFMYFSFFWGKYILRIFRGGVTV